MSDKVDLRGLEPEEVMIKIIKDLLDIDLDCSKSQALDQMKDVLNNWSDKLNWFVSTPRHDQ